MPHKPGIFLSHTHSDSDFANRLAKDLKEAGAEVWIDNAEIKVGESLIEKVSEGIERMDYLAVILSRNSVNSQWVREEIEIAMTQEISGHRIKVLPLLYEPCALPIFLANKRYADFTSEEKYAKSLSEVILSLGIDRNAFGVKKVIRRSDAGANKMKERVNGRMLQWGILGFVVVLFLFLAFFAFSIKDIRIVDPEAGSPVIKTRLDNLGACVADIKVKLSPFYALSPNEYIILLLKMKLAKGYWLPTFPVKENEVIDGVAHFVGVKMGGPADPPPIYEIVVGTTSHHYSSLHHHFDEMPNDIVQHERRIVDRICQ